MPEHSLPTGYRNVRTYKIHAHRIKRNVCIVLISLLIPLTSHAIEKTEHLPLVVPLSIHGLGNSVGVGYAGINLLGSADFTTLLFMGDMQGATFSFTDMVIVDDWFRLDGRLAHFSKLAPLSNYSRGSASTPVAFRPVISLNTAQVVFTLQPSRFVFFKIEPGINITKFDLFHTKDKKEINTPSIHITDLDQPYVAFEFGLRYADKQDMNRVSAVIKRINKNASSGYSGDQITSYILQGQYFYYDKSALFVQYFHSDASVNNASSIISESDVADTLSINCAASSTLDKCQKLNQALSYYVANHNKYGTAEPLGGPERMKAYPANYFRAAHSRYLTMELRFNQFDTIDNRSIFFHIFTEIAQIADLESNLSAANVRSNGFDLGINMNKDSVYKLTVAHGGEGWVGHLTVARSW